MPKTKPIDFYVDKNGCFVCTSHSRNAGGYCYYKREGGKRTYLHRHVYEECFGFLPEGVLVRHSCDNPSCINPEHLLSGTDKDNAMDRVKRGRSADMRGMNGPGVRLKDADILAIREDSTSNNHELAEAYGVTHSNISAIRLGKSWKNLLEVE
jgi:hypothetical protein